MRRYYRFKRYPFGQVTDHLGAHSIVDIQWNDSAVLQHRCLPDNPELLDLNLQPVNLLLPIIRSFSEQDEQEDEVYYYHGDHLGSASWITDKTGTPVQYIHYAPYGELIANQRATSYDERFKFTGKERDTESGYNYHGARFLWGDAGFWLSVDPLADKYPGLTPYLYCNGNPIMLVDPDGRKYASAEDEAMHQTMYDETSRKIEELKDMVGKRKQLRILQDVLSELNYMKTTEEFTFSFDNSKNENEGGTSIVGGIIVMSLPKEGRLGLAVHEASHAYDLAKMILKLGGDINDVGEKALLLIRTIRGEQKAYQRQFLVGGPDCMPSSKNLQLLPGQTIIFGNNTLLYIKGIKTQTNDPDQEEFPYGKLPLK